MTDRWAVKGTDPTVKEQFDRIHANYDQRHDEDITQQRALELLMDGVDVEPAVDYGFIREVIREENNTLRADLKEAFQGRL